MPSKREFEIADEAITRAVGEIERAVAELMEDTLRLDGAGTYVIEQLFAKLIDRNPGALNWLNRQHGEAAIRLANAIMGWRDKWSER
jgi:hypothetical protein